MEGRKKERWIEEDGREEGPVFLIQTLQCVTDNKSFNPFSPKSLHIPHEGIILSASDFMG